MKEKILKELFELFLWEFRTHAYYHAWNSTILVYWLQNTSKMILGTYFLCNCISPLQSFNLELFDICNDILFGLWFLFK